MPGKYTVVLTFGGKSYQQPLTLLMDPRVKTSDADLAQQFRLSKELYNEWLALNPISESVRLIRGQIVELRPRVPAGDLKTHLDALTEKLQTFAGASSGGPGAATGAARATVTSTTGRLRTLFNLIENVDLAPTPQAAAAVPDIVRDSHSLQEIWREITSQDIAALNQELRGAGLPILEIARLSSKPNN
jgi:hypothetical protein